MLIKLYIYIHTYIYGIWWKIYLLSKLKEILKYYKSKLCFTGRISDTVALSQVYGQAT